ncbi:type VI secretion system lipoprotein TssJ [Trinickia fusca]|uniref:Type VI secretion system lipoprotein TssJ n=2 Tax=Trinickia fusca TaxID=2419777 RepID=A0A494X1E0_9BURK|nr:type VI secretion system lipoprotein TssJ [Trinickia fusca]RKP44537.1 type VI secretion system lipoprotein TssJ [Trinickia fusca]
MLRWHNTYALVRLFLSAVLIAGCAATERSISIPYSVTLQVAPDINPDAQRRPAPIALEVFRLKSGDSFQRADYFALQDKPAEALGGDLVGVDRVILRPGESRTLHYTGDEAVRQLGLVGGYRNLEKSRWKSVVPLPLPKQTNLFKFWQMSPHEMRLVIAVRNNGLEPLATGGQTQ